MDYAPHIFPGQFAYKLTNLFIFEKILCEKSKKYFFQKTLVEGSKGPMNLKSVLAGYLILGRTTNGHRNLETESSQEPIQGKLWGMQLNEAVYRTAPATPGLLNMSTG